MIGYLGLGSNVGDRLGYLNAAVAELSDRGLRVLARSGVYETEPQGDAVGQGDFLNACLKIETELEPEELLDLCKRVERSLGREPGGARHAARPIDVDLLLLGEREFRSARLQLPHAEILERRFVLEPLLELDPGLRLPDGTELAGALDGLSGQRVERVGSL